MWELLTSRCFFTPTKTFPGERHVLHISKSKECMHGAICRNNCDLFRRLCRSGLDTPSPLQSAASLLWNIGYSDKNIHLKAHGSLDSFVCFDYGTIQEMVCGLQFGQEIDEVQQRHFKAALQMRRFDMRSTSRNFECSTCAPDGTAIRNQFEVNGEHGGFQHKRIVNSVSERRLQVDCKLGIASRDTLTGLSLDYEVSHSSLFVCPNTALQLCTMDRRIHFLVARWEKEIQRGALSILLSGWNGSRPFVDSGKRTDLATSPLDSSELFRLNPISLGPYFPLLICSLQNCRKSRDDLFVWSFYVEAKIKDSELTGLG